MTREEVKARIEDIGILAGVRVHSAEDALFAAQTLYAAGIPVVEIPMTVPGGLDVIRELAQKYPDMAVGVGTVLDGETVDRALDAGARFVTSTGLLPDVNAAALKRGAILIPGALTPTEVICAWKAGADYVKIYPTAAMGGGLYIRSLNLPLPQIKLIASGGVNQHTAMEYIRAGAIAVGVGTELLPIDAVRHHQHHRIHELARRLAAMVKEGRQLGNGPK